MKDKEREIIDEITRPDYLSRAKARAKRRKSLWNLILLPFLFGFWACVTYVLFRLMWWIHILVYPQHDGRMHEFWRKGNGTPAFISSFLLLIPLLFAALPISMLLSNCLAWCIPMARKVFEKEAIGYKRASFKEAIRDLLIVSKYIVPICLLLSLIGALTLKELR